MPGERVRMTIDEAGVADVLLDRPPANAIDLVTLVELKQVAEALTADSAVRVVMLRSALEPIFAGGFDLDLLGHAWGGTTRLPRLIGRGAALDLLLRGHMIGADEAERIGLITFASDPQDLDQRARDLAAELAALPPLAVREIKRCVDLGLDGPLSVGLALEERGNVALADTADAREGVAAFTERRRATFKGA